ncbi:MAG: flagellar biosynthesis anti-sigma factor FlgM [Tepidisphaeraceae bacterium]
MNSINSVTGAQQNSAVQKVVQNPIQKEISSDPPAQVRGNDRVELSGMSQLLQTLKSGGDVRVDKVAQIRAQIDAGSYETDDKLTVAADKLLDELSE